ncbi:MucBP domain-containing protein [Enterococcus sp. DIV0660C]|uniref:MucBP domain-containing protein n=1 Tax=Enterococcus sp. DIV0660C TaxID=2230880 RepID=UPI001A8E77B7|nr:MucBP domain-containing protein [Enterococcus sp. DIV0660C]
MKSSTYKKFVLLSSVFLTLSVANNLVTIVHAETTDQTTLSSKATKTKTTQTSENSSDQTSTSVKESKEKNISSSIIAETATSATENETKADDAIKKDVLPRITPKIATGSVSYKANSSVYTLNTTYTGTVTLTNKDGDSIPAGTTIVISIPTEAIDYSAIDLTDENISSYFDVTIDKNAGTITFVVKNDIVGDTTISADFHTKVIGNTGTTYNVSATTTSNGQDIPTIVGTPKLTVDTNTPPIYDYVNSYWGISDGTPGNFVGKDGSNVGGLPTGNFTRTSDVIQNFIQVNYSGENILPADCFYRFAWYIEPIGNGKVTITDEDIANIVVRDTITQAVIPKQYYKVYRDATKPDNNEIWIDLQSEKTSGGYIKRDGSYEASVSAHANNDSITYPSQSYIYMATANGGNIAGGKHFDLNNQFLTTGDSTVFANLSVEDKTFYVGDLTAANIKEKLLKNIVAKDTNDGDISSQVTVDDSQVQADTPGKYKVTYSVTNSTGHISTKTATVTILERKDGAPVTVEYVDEDGNDIAEKDVLNGKVDDPYTSQAKTIDNYTLLKEPDNKEGKFTDKAQTVTYIYQGKLLFVDAPTKLQFGEHTISAKDETYSLKSLDKNLLIKDLRKNGSTWSLTAKLNQAFIGTTTSKKLGATLYYMNPSQGKQAITTDESVVIHNQTTSDHEEQNVSQDWQSKADTLQLFVPGGKAVVDTYDATIEWDLNDVVPNE